MNPVIHVLSDTGTSGCVLLRPCFVRDELWRAASVLNDRLNSPVSWKCVSLPVALAQWNIMSGRTDSGIHFDPEWREESPLHRAAACQCVLRRSGTTAELLFQGGHASCGWTRTGS